MDGAADKDNLPMDEEFGVLRRKDKDLLDPEISKEKSSKRCKFSSSLPHATSRCV